MKFANHYSHISQSSWYSFQNILKGWIFGIVILKQSKWETNKPKLSYITETWICFYTFANIKFVELFDAFDFFLVTTTHFLATTIIISDVCSSSGWVGQGPGSGLGFAAAVTTCHRVGLLITLSTTDMYPVLFYPFSDSVTFYQLLHLF